MEKIGIWRSEISENRLTWRGRRHRLRVGLYPQCWRWCAPLIIDSSVRPRCGEGNWRDKTPYCSNWLWTKSHLQGIPLRRLKWKLNFENFWNDTTFGILTAGFVEDKWVPEIYQVGHIIHRNNPTEIFSLFKPSIDHAIIQLQSKSINLDFDDRIEMNLTLIAWKYRSWRIV